MFVFAISPKEDAFSGSCGRIIRPAHFEIVFRQQHYSSGISGAVRQFGVIAGAVAR